MREEEEEEEGVLDVGKAPSSQLYKGFDHIY